MAKKVWRIPVLMDSKGDIVKVWKPRTWTIDPNRDYYETEVVMNAFRNGSVNTAELLKGVKSPDGCRLIVRKDDGDSKESTQQIYELLLQQPEVQAKGVEMALSRFVNSCQAV